MLASQTTYSVAPTCKPKNNGDVRRGARPRGGRPLASSPDVLVVSLVTRPRPWPNCRHGQGPAGRSELLFGPSSAPRSTWRPIGSASASPRHQDAHVPIPRRSASPIAYPRLLQFPICFSNFSVLLPHVRPRVRALAVPRPARGAFPTCRRLERQGFKNAISRPRWFASARCPKATPRDSSIVSSTSVVVSAERSVCAAALRRSHRRGRKHRPSARTT